MVWTLCEKEIEPSLSRNNNKLSEALQCAELWRRCRLCKLTDTHQRLRLTSSAGTVGRLRLLFACAFSHLFWHSFLRCSHPFWHRLFTLLASVLWKTWKRNFRNERYQFHRSDADFPVDKKLVKLSLFFTGHNKYVGNIFAAVPAARFSGRMWPGPPAADLSMVANVRTVENLPDRVTGTCNVS